jgi:hypothetical protein
VSEAPGNRVILGERIAAPTAPTSTSTAFIVGPVQKGSTTTPVLVTSITDAANRTGERLVAHPEVYDAVEAMFREGASHVYIGREVGAAAVTAKKQAVDAASKKTLEFFAKSAGEWGNKIKVVLTLSAGKVIVQVQFNSIIVETSPELDTNAEVVAWAMENSQYVTIVDISAAESAGDAKTQTLELAEGDDKYGELGTPSAETAFKLFTRDLGPGQILAPTGTTEAIQKVALTHCAEFNRRALLNLGSTATAAEHIARGQALRGATAKFGTLVDNWANIPGASLGTTRKVPMAAILAGVIAYNEGHGYDAGTAAAGPHGKARYAASLVNARTTSQYAEMNDAGVIGSRVIRGVVTLFGNVTLVNQTTEPNWKSFTGSRLIMAVCALADEVMENYDFAKIDGHGYVFKELEGDLAGTACLPFYKSNSLYGQTPEEAFEVNTGPDVNTPESIAREEIRAQIAVVISPNGERLVTEVVKVPITQGLG